MQIIGTGVGRTGTYSLRIAINQLGFGPCFHMEDVLQNMPVQVPAWNAAVDGNADWPAIYDGFNSAVDWPTAAFFGELAAAYPEAKFILTVRSAESWADSFGSTIYTLLAGRDEAPPEMRDWLEMCIRVIAKCGFGEGLDRDALIAGFNAHNEAVRAAIPAERLLEFEVRQGWGLLCDFLGLAAPDEDFPRSNNREKFWDLVNGNN
ncbi:MAG: sulfotransferase family protein [Pseudomonadota bacterium]